MGKYRKAMSRVVSHVAGMSRSGAIATGAALAKAAARLADGAAKKRKTYNYKGQGSAPATRTGSRMSTRSGSRTGTVGGSTPAEPSGGGAELTKVSLSYGRLPKHDLRQAWKLLESQKQAVFMRWNAVSRFQSSNQGFLLAWQQQNAPGSTLTLPVHIYDVTSGFNAVQGTIGAYSPAWYMNMSSETPTGPSGVFFSKLGQNDNTQPWTLEDAPSVLQSLSNVPLRRDLLEYTQVKMLCYGTTNYPVKWKIQFIQLTKDYLHPDTVLPDPSVALASGVNYTEERIAFWSSIARPLLYSPINIGQPNFVKDYKVLASKSFTIQPKLTNESDTVPHQKEISMFMRWNRIRKFDWNQSSIGTAVNGAAMQTEIADLRATVQPSARIYMLVTATAPRINTGAFTSLYDPSYDIVIRNKSTIIE